MQTQSKKDRLLQIEEIIRARQTSLHSAEAERNNSQSDCHSIITNDEIIKSKLSTNLLLVSCERLFFLDERYLVNDHVLIKMDTFIRSYKIQHPNCTIIVPILVSQTHPSCYSLTPPTHDKILQRLENLGLCKEMKENVILLNDEMSPFVKFSKLFSNWLFENMLKRGEIQFTMHNYPTLFCLKMFLKKPYPSCLNNTNNNIIVGAYTWLPEYVFGVTNVWVNEKATFGVYKMKNSDDLLIHSNQSGVLENLVLFGFLESVEPIKTISARSLLGHTVSFGGSKSDNLFILPCHPDIDTIVASVPSQVQLDYEAWLNLVRMKSSDDRVEWHSYAKHCEPTPFLSIPEVSNFPALYLHENPRLGVNRSKAEFIDVEEVWDLLSHNTLPKKTDKSLKTQSANITEEYSVLIVLDDSFNDSSLKNALVRKLRRTPQLERNVVSLRAKITNWIHHHKLALFPISTSNSEIDPHRLKLLLRNRDDDCCKGREFSFPISNNEQVSNLRFKQRFNSILNSRMSVLLFMLFNGLEKSGVINWNDDHNQLETSFSDYLNWDHNIWQELRSSATNNLEHYHFTSSTAKDNDVLDPYQTLFPNLKPTRFVFTPMMVLDGVRMHMMNTGPIENGFIGNYATSAYRMAIIDGLTEGQVLKEKQPMH